jgi:hypothetical protein
MPGELTIAGIDETWVTIRSSVQFSEARFHLLTSDHSPKSRVFGKFDALISEVAENAGGLNRSMQHWRIWAFVIARHTLDC